jgi:hypothetical protein
MGQYYKAVIKEHGAKTWKSFDSWTFNCGAKLMEHSYVPNFFVMYIKNLIFDTPTRVVWAGDYAENEKGKDDNLYILAKEQQVLTTCGMEGLHDLLVQKLPEMRYLVNDSKKMYVDYSKIQADSWGYKIDPLPLLCAEGNGQGGGDYWGKNEGLVGSWARDFISITSEIPQGYKELVPEFREGRDLE